MEEKKLAHLQTFYEYNAALRYMIAFCRYSVDPLTANQAQGNVARVRRFIESGIPFICW